MNPLQFLPHTIFLIDPSIRIGNVVARKKLKPTQALEYMRTGQYREQFDDAGNFVGIVYSPQTARPERLYYDPNDFGVIELPGLKFMQPANATPTWMRTVTQSI